MDQKSWIWKRKSTEKTLLYDKGNISSRRNEELTEELLAEKAEMERDLKILDDKLSSALMECKANDNMAKKQIKMAQEAIAGWEKAELETVSLKQELDYVLQQKAASEERLGHLDAALKQCMQQLRYVREEQEKRVHGAVANTREEFEKARIVLEQKLSEAVKRLAKLEAENTHLSKALSGKDKVVADLSKYRTHVEADLNALVLRVESAEKENTSLKYEVRVLEKERDIRNEEREFTRRTSEVTQKQLQESVKKIAKLESECQKLRLLVRKRLPGPAALAKMKNEVEMLGKDQVEIRRRRAVPFLIDAPCDTPSKKIPSLTEQLHAMEVENRILKNELRKKSGEQHFSRIMCARTPSRLSRAGEIDESLEGQTTAEPGHQCFSPKHSLAASSEMERDDKADSEESWASALISEVDHLKTEKLSATSSHRNMGSSDMNLMSDFAEMEKLAVVSLDYPAGSSHHSSEAGNGITIGPSRSPSGGKSSPAPGMELVPVYDFQSDSLPDNLGGNRVPAKFEDVLKIVLDHFVSQSNPLEVLEDIRAALSQNHGSNVIEGTDSTDTLNSQEVNGHVSLVSPSKSSSLDSFYVSNGHGTSVKRDSDKIVLSNVSIAVHKILELLEGINTTSDDNCVAKSLSGKADKLLSYKDTKPPTGYIVRVFQWKAAELTTILRHFAQTCNDFLNGTADLQQLVQLLASSFEWVMNHCFSVQDVSSMKDEIFNHLDWEESKSESEIDNGSANNLVESNQLHTNREDMPYQSDTVNFKIELQESKVITEDSDTVTMEQCKGKTANKIEKQQNSETRVMEAGLEEGKSHQNVSHLENEVDKNDQYCRTPEETSVDIKTQLQSMTSKEVVPVARKDWNHQLRTEMEIAAASEKLAECQETILNLGKQLKALASPVEAALLEKETSTTSGTVATSVPTLGRNSSQRSSLLDKMQAEDYDQTEVFHMINEVTQNVNSNPSVNIIAVVESWGKLNDLKANNALEEEKNNMATSMAIVPVKTKEGKSFLKKLFWLKKRSAGMKASFP